MDEQDRLTAWYSPTRPVTAAITECPDCFAIGLQDHDSGCKGRKRRHIVKTTQFGPVDYMDWCCRMIAMWGRKGVFATIKTDRYGLIALFKTG